jgi:hypothetical protein
MLYTLIFIFLGFNSPVVIHSPVYDRADADYFSFSPETGNLFILNMDFTEINWHRPFTDISSKAIKPDFKVSGEYSIVSVSEVNLEGSNYLLINISDWSAYGNIKSFLLPEPYQSSQDMIPIFKDRNDFNTGFHSVTQIGSRLIANILDHDGKVIHLTVIEIEIELLKNQNMFELFFKGDLFISKLLPLDGTYSVSTMISVFGSNINNNIFMVSTLDPEFKVFELDDYSSHGIPISIPVGKSRFDSIDLKELKAVKNISEYKKWWRSFSRFQGVVQLEYDKFLVSYTIPVQDENKLHSLIVEIQDHSGAVDRLVTSVSNGYFLGYKDNKVFILEVNVNTSNHIFHTIYLN